MVWYSAPPASAPDPRLTARSMLSLGTELFLAFWMASKSVGLPSGSPPPVRAATSMFLMSLANIFPRRASMTAFLCLVVAHLEWPDMRWSLFLLVLVHDLGHLLDEELVEPVVAGDLGVERRGEQVPLPDRDDPTHGVSRGHGGDDLHVVPHILHPGRPD